MKKSKAYLYIIVVVALIVIACVYFSFNTVSRDNVRIMATYPETYTDSTYHFSVRYPDDLRLDTFANPSKPGDVVILENTMTGMGMQIVISPFATAGDTAMTAAFIKQNIPDIVMVNPQTIVIGGTGRGVSFLDGTSTTANRQVWFTDAGNFYQITAPAAFDPKLTDMLSTWKWILVSAQPTQ
jgi:hypothetical protein